MEGKSKGKAIAEKRIEKLLSAYVPLPMCIVNVQGKVTRASDKIDEVFKYDGIKGADIFALTGIKHGEFFSEGINEKALTLSRNDKVFKIQVGYIGNGDEKRAIVYFYDITNYETLKTMYNDEHICMATINVDNYDELTSSTSEEKRLALSTDIDKAVRQWAARGNAFIIRYKENMYFMVFENTYLEKIVENKFAILDDIREIETEADFPVTLSIGIGAGGKHPAQTDQYAAAALDLALGRGGDQAVVKKGSKIEYFGGKMQTVEKGNKGKSRIIAHAIKQLVDQSSKVIIMGHRNPDMDSFGSALGIFRIVANRNKDAYIVINSYFETLAEIYNQAKDTEVYNFINSEKAISMMDKDTLLIVLDTHRPSLTECRELLELTEKIVVIDHHRKAEEYIENATLYYMEPYASSTAELVTEILQYSGDKKNIAKLEVEGLLAGISMDTNRFAVKTGVRTFEAASWLRRSGADTTAVKRFFQTDAEAFKIKARCIADAEIKDNGLAYSVSHGHHPDIQVINAQAADELLSVKNVRASFVAGIDEKGTTVISARSLGAMNMQTIMEKLGGGGHLTTAGAQVSCTPEEALQKIQEIVDSLEGKPVKNKEEK
ncbi:DHH family phosphoesterase [Aminipila luticellarii]|uniref:DHH family phosphoesterase n=1 Tax=Aminipila luticellarii TaxID=2507160 RepID=A0A410PS99_9FIRM|nr:DHH family phosphoesterase [Aminipila luticellarii]QAT41765.1 DHH family phosphoesterase [Aminipila luticellarii]